jgi:hypothetical protein
MAGKYFLRPAASEYLLCRNGRSLWQAAKFADVLARVVGPGGGHWRGRLGE